MSILPFSTHTCTITRTTSENQGSTDVGDPTQVVITVATNIPCRFDRASGRKLVGVITQHRIAGRMFIDASLKDNTGKPIDIQESDLVTLSGEKGTFSIDRVDKVYDATSLHHFEVDLSDVNEE